MKIEYVTWGLAATFKDRIELNENLKQYPRLHNKILQHELKHLPGRYTIKDLKHDYTEKLDLEILKFMFRHPKTFIQFLPLWVHNGRLTISIPFLILWLLLTGWVFVVYYASTIILGV